jgi:hypothetical protein
MSPTRLSPARRAVAGVALALAVPTFAFATPPERPPLAYWAFNCYTTCGDANFSPDIVSGAQSASMSSTFEPDNGVNESGTRLNAVGFFEARSALTLRTGSGGINNGRNLTWLVNTTKAPALSVSFASRRSPGGFTDNQFQYSLDGVTWEDFGPRFGAGPDWALVEFDLRHVHGLRNNPRAGFRIIFDGGSATSASEYFLIDNLQVEGK